MSKEDLISAIRGLIEEHNICVLNPDDRSPYRSTEEGCCLYGDLEDLLATIEYLRGP
jgi:hypothetical protein